MKTGTSADGSDDFRNVANTFGWIVEIDPFNPASTPKKRTALGRFAHEGAWPGAVVPGKPLVWYMGCDSRNEYIYKYVSNAVWDPADIGKGTAAGDKYLDDGKLYVAKFNADGSGQWVALKFGSNGITASNTAYAFADQADVLVNNRTLRTPSPTRPMYWSIRVSLPTLLARRRWTVRNGARSIQPTARST
jgi:uncharacterized protein